LLSRKEEVVGMVSPPGVKERQFSGGKKKMGRRDRGKKKNKQKKEGMHEKGGGNHGVVPCTGKACNRRERILTNEFKEEKKNEKKLKTWGAEAANS